MFDKSEFLRETERHKQSYLVKYPETKGFAYDGPNDTSRWANVPLKILFLLKETYGKNKDCICMDSLEYNKPNVKGNFYENTTNRYLARIAYGLSGVHSNRDFKIKTTGLSQKKLSNSYSGVATIEIKKSSNAKWKSSDKKVLEHAIWSKDFIKWQIDHLQPDIIFCCGGVVSGFVRNHLFSLKDESNIFNLGRVTVINSHHPSKPGYKVDEYVKMYKDNLIKSCKNH